MTYTILDQAKYPSKHLRVLANSAEDVIDFLDDHGLAEDEWVNFVTAGHKHDLDDFPVWASAYRAEVLNPETIHLSVKVTRGAAIRNLEAAYDIIDTDMEGPHHTAFGDWGYTMSIATGETI